MKGIQWIVIVCLWVLTASAEAFVVDNVDPGFSTDGGTWHKANNSSGFFGDDYLYNGRSGGAEWRFPIPMPGEYMISAQWAVNANHSSSVTYTVIQGDKAYTADPVSQKIDGGRLNRIGVLTLDAGVAVVRMTWDGGYAVADAVDVSPTKVPGEVQDLALRFACDPPTAEIAGVRTYLVGATPELLAETPIADITSQADGLYWELPRSAYGVGKSYRFAATFYRGDIESGLSNIVEISIHSALTPPSLGAVEIRWE